jgi:carbonic anhydrase
MHAPSSPALQRGARRPSIAPAHRRLGLLALAAAALLAGAVPGRAAAEGAAVQRAPSIAEPMEVVRERLAQRLGALKPLNSSDPNVVRVTTSRAASAPAAEAAPASSAASRGPGAAKTPAVASRRPAPRRPEGTDARAPDPADHVHAHAAPHWDYEGPAGPSEWARLNPEFAACATGTRQSPIDIRDGIKVELDPVQFDYKPSAFSVIDNGHTVQVDVAPGNWIEVMGRRWQLVQFHFPRPSEERIDGKPFDRVAHLVHKDAEGRIAVVAVLLQSGSAQPVVQAVWNNLPLEKGQPLAARAPLDLNALLPEQRGYYTYMGSLTTPPCSEGVLWMVMKQPVGISPEQIGIFARLYPMNARPVQGAAGRLIKESN